MKQKLKKKISKEPLVKGVTPRWIMISGIFNEQDHTKNGTAMLLIIDSKKEQEIGLGRKWSHPPLEGRSCHVFSALLRLINVEPNLGEKVTLNFDTFSFLHTISGSPATVDAFTRNLWVQLLAKLFEVIISKTN